MSWLEIVSVRTSGKTHVTALMELCRQLRPPAGRTTKLMLYRSAGYETDLSLHIHWVSTDERQGRSDFGQEIKLIFSKFGIVSYTLWTEQEINTNS